jgi:hypothetical protein
MVNRDELARFAATPNAVCWHRPPVVVGHKLKHLVEFQCMNTLPANLETTLGEPYQAV